MRRPGHEGTKARGGAAAKLPGFLAWAVPDGMAGSTTGLLERFAGETMCIEAPTDPGGRDALLRTDGGSRRGEAAAIRAGLPSLVAYVRVESGGGPMLGTEASAATCPQLEFAELCQAESERAGDVLWVGFEHPLWAVWFALLGALMLSFLGLLTSIWADKFDHAAAISNFVVTPLSLLSGTFYSVEQLSPAFQAVSHANPFFYVISGFRYGMLGQSDSPILVGAAGLLLLNVALFAACYTLLRSGWKIKN